MKNKVISTPKIKADLEVLKFKQLVVEINRYQVTLHGREIKLTPKEFAILRLFLKQTGQVFTRRDLHQQAHPGQTVVICDQTINTHIKNIKKKIGSYSQYIRSVRSIGYTFRD